MTSLRILRAMGPGEESAKEIGQKTAYHHTVVLRHLNELEKLGLVEARLYPRNGRPNRRWSLTGRRHPLWGYDRLVERLEETAAGALEAKRRLENGDWEAALEAIECLEYLQDGADEVFELSQVEP